MPELPEVETVARQLGPMLIGRTVRRVQIIDAKLAGLDQAALRGRTIVDVRRVDKRVVLELAARGNGAAPVWLAVHLRMTGRLLWNTTGRTGRIAHLRARIRCDEGQLLFVDARRFGTMTVYEERVEETGLDPLSAVFSTRALEQFVERSRQPIKTWLLRQDRLAGLGNIYASEALYAARVSPLRAAGSLTAEELARLRRAIRSILRRAIQHCGTTFSDFQGATGEVGGFQRFLRVYEREGEPCAHCGAAIARIVQSGRSTYYCPRCAV